MNITKALIAKKISEDLSLNLFDSKNIIDSFIKLIKSESANKDIKINKFGTFKYHVSPKRIGRNPKTKESYIIPRLLKLSFISSNRVKKELN